MKNLIKKLLREAISASEAHTDEGAVQTVIDGKRDLGFITMIGTTLEETDFWDLIKKNGLKTIKVPSSEHEAYIYFRRGAENKAKELWDIAEKYGGYLAHDATPEDSRRIGQLLGYRESDIEDYIKYNTNPSQKSIFDENI